MCGLLRHSSSLTLDLSACIQCSLNIYTRMSNEWLYQRRHIQRSEKYRIFICVYINTYIRLHFITSVYFDGFENKPILNCYYTMLYQVLPNEHNATNHNLNLYFYRPRSRTPVFNMFSLLHEANRNLLSQLIPSSCYLFFLRRVRDSWFQIPRKWYVI